MCVTVLSLWKLFASMLGPQWSSPCGGRKEEVDVFQALQSFQIFVFDCIYFILFFFNRQNSGSQSLKAAFLLIELLGVGCLLM